MENNLLAGTMSRNNTEAATGSETTIVTTPCDPSNKSEHQEKAALDSPIIPSSGPPKAPDGGLQAWLQVLGGFLIYFNTWYFLAY